MCNTKRHLKELFFTHNPTLTTAFSFLHVSLRTVYTAATDWTRIHSWPWWTSAEESCRINKKRCQWGQAPLLTAGGDCNPTQNHQPQGIPHCYISVFPPWQTVFQNHHQVSKNKNAVAYMLPFIQWPEGQESIKGRDVKYFPLNTDPDWLCIYTHVF